ncbi:hypothetical protein FH972_022171 [Carpinus fangiana]|uniref:TauD/TfdA-like domain-containing protein n=1 Tax=Carpinus fangiana TaxID=176857 RepID=A0A5N6KRU3_9ROSI|nr:hypothetical protein FH972_022171 [Carpinus fangiana]
MTADLSSKDTAYTEVFLPPHNDTTYFTLPIGLQMFHLLSHERGTGGESQLVNGIAAAHVLKQKDADAFDVLCKTKLMAHASGNEGVMLEPVSAFSVFNVDPITDRLVSVRWNPADRTFVLPGDHSTHAEDVEKWYDAAEKYQNILNDRTNRSTFYEFKLQPGRPVMFDNWKLMHGRSSFTGSRKMCGGYIDHDYFMSTCRALGFKHQNGQL